MNGGSGQVLAGTYVMPAAPIMLFPAPSPAFTTNGFSMALQAPAGSYLIEASPDVSNLANWQPLLYYSSTNSSFSFYFSDLSAANANRRFYRASLLSGGSVAPSIPIVLGFGSQPLAANGVNLMLQGPVGANYVIQSSTNLVNWVPFTNFVSPSSPCVFRDTEATNFSRRFYRAVMQ